VFFIGNILIQEKHALLSHLLHIVRIVIVTSKRFVFLAELLSETFILILAHYSHTMHPAEPSNQFFDRIQDSTGLGLSHLGRHILAHGICLTLDSQL
jgi:hypothetical protein